MTSILLFHDVVELFLGLASEYLNAGKTGQEFMSYWDAINQKLPNKDFGQKDSMNRLNKARGNWKHYGILLSTTEIENFRTNVAAFFRENTPKVFGVTFEEISMATLVGEKEVQDRLVMAEQLSRTGDFKTALKEVAIAFQDLLDRFEWKIMEQRNSVPPRGIARRRFSRIEQAAPRELSRFAGAIEKEVNTLHEQVKLLSLGIDYRRYIRFQGLVPIVVVVESSGENSMPYQVLGDGRGQSHQDYLFCYQFVIDCALRIQEIQFA